MTLQRFQPTAKCNKCGGTIVSVRFCAGAPCDHWGNHCGRSMNSDPVMHRRCERCCHWWDEVPLDAEPDTQSTARNAGTEAERG